MRPMGSRLRAVARACVLIFCAALSAPAAEDGPFPRAGADSWQWPPDHPFARYRTLSPPDCVDASAMVADHLPGRIGTTYMRVEHIGDPGTDELAGQIAHEVTWDVSLYTGLAVPPAAQRGYVDRAGQSAFQLRCADAGFFINSTAFSHGQPVSGEGPNVSVGRDFDPGFAVFAQGGWVVVEADVRAPTVAGPPAPAEDGTAQLGFYVYYHDLTTVSAIAQIVGLLDNRAPGVNGSGVEWTGDDGHTGFVTSPLAPEDGTGMPVRFAVPLPGSAWMQYGHGWGEVRHVGFMVSPAHFAAALRELRARGAQISGNPADYVVTAVGVLGEVFPGTSHDHEVALGASVSNVALRTMPPSPFHWP